MDLADRIPVLQRLLGSALPAGASAFMLGKLPLTNAGFALQLTESVHLAFSAFNRASWEVSMRLSASSRRAMKFGKWSRPMFRTLWTVGLLAQRTCYGHTWTLIQMQRALVNRACPMQSLSYAIIINYAKDSPNTHYHAKAYHMQ